LWKSRETGGICRRAFDGGVSMFQMPSVMQVNPKRQPRTCMKKNIIFLWVWRDLGFEPSL